MIDFAFLQPTVQLGGGIRQGSPHKREGGMVVRTESMDRELFEVTDARNRGLFGSAVDSEKQAQDWLLDPHAP